MDSNDSAIDIRTRGEVIGLTTFTALILVLAIPANGLVLLAYLTSSSARRKPSNYLLVNFTISEFITAILVIPLQLVVHIVKPSIAVANGPLCILVGVSSYPFYIISVGTMVCISIDRLYAIRSPLNYRSKMSAKRIAVMIGFTWVHGVTFALVFALVNAIGYNEVSVECGILWREIHMAIAIFLAITHIVLPFVLLALLNYNLVAGLRKQNHTLESHFERHVSVVVDRVGGRRNQAKQGEAVGRYIYIYIYKKFSYVKISLLTLSISHSFPARHNIQFLSNMYFLRSTYLTHSLSARCARNRLV